MAERTYVPTRDYDFELTINDTDYSQDLTSVRIVSSLATAYPVVVLTLFIDPNDIISKELYGQDFIKLTGRALTAVEVGSSFADLQLDLIYITSSYHLPMQSKMPGGGLENGGPESTIDRTQLNITTVVRNSYNSATGMVNAIGENISVADMINNIASQVEGLLELEVQDINPTIIDQIIVPPLPFFQAVKYLDKTFGIYKSPCSTYCQLDGTIQIKNLKHSMTKSQTFTINHLTMDETIDSKDDGNSVQENVFYSHKPISAKWGGNKKFAFYSKDMQFISKPKDDLYSIIPVDLESVCQENGLVDGNNKIFFDDMISRRKYYTDHTGYEYDDTFARANVSREIANLSTLNVEVGGFFDMLNLTNVGRSVKFNTNSLFYTDYTGKYILFTSDIKFKKISQWTAGAELTLVRTNRKLT